MSGEETVRNAEKRRKILSGFFSEFEKTRERLHRTRKDLFENLIDYAIGWFPPACAGENGTDAALTPLTLSMMSTVAALAGDDDWMDVPGELYMQLAMHEKGFGQFFTPKTVCDCMAAVSDAGKTQEKGEGPVTVADPCCGSGRMLLAARTSAIRSGHDVFVSGADLDPLCTKMTAWNLAIHGCRGEAVCMNSLTNEFRFGYAVNELLAETGIPSIRLSENPQEFSITNR